MLIVNSSALIKGNYEKVASNQTVGTEQVDGYAFFFCMIFMLMYGEPVYRERCKGFQFPVVIINRN